MATANVEFASYISIVIGLLLIAFHRELIEYYEKFAARDGSAFPRFVTTTRLILGGAVLIVTGILRLV